ncbi:hypothetical protein KY311_05150 [Candidatus Woesearchaeota archaeon]|nr:hypothetical protein [Candidatus Woesearchaeota archaeon]
MNAKKVTKEEWEKLVKHAVEKQHHKRSIAFTQHFAGFLHFIPISIVLGTIAAALFAYRYGFEDLIRVLLSWTIGVTLVATLSAAFVNRFKKFYESQ